MAKTEQSLLPVEFLHHWRTLVKRHRMENVAHYHLIKAWQRGERIPGYRTNPPANELGCQKIPLGWSIHNIIASAR